tara:strand:+ start:364 stop:1005 length:642 start_codon:yes stop_codon:yes gene_type:complete
MESFLDQQTCDKMLNVSRETSVKFEIYLKTLKKWQNNLNLVGTSTLDDPWRRHILDCGQISRYIDQRDREIIDLGSGAGLPGIILSIMGYKNVLMVDSDFKKTVFISEALRACGLKSTVLTDRVENLKSLKNKTIVSRAFSSISLTLNLLKEKIQKDTELILLKGKQAKKEIIDAEFYWKTNQINDSKLLSPNFNTYTSISNSKSFVVVCTFV